MPEKNRLFFLKLGGSLITDKTQAHTALPEVLQRLAGEIAEALQTQPGLNLVLGHGSGSFGHYPARQYQTRKGVSTSQGWQGFTEVWHEAAALNHLVLEACHSAGLPAMAFPASAAVSADNGRVVDWNLEPIRSALLHGLLPVVYGDVVFDRSLGGTILSTEELFVHLAETLQPEVLLLAGNEPGVWSDFPARTHLLTKITPGSISQIYTGLKGSAATDVTGGMVGKVQAMLSLVEKYSGLRVRIFSGKEPGRVKDALVGEAVGTLLCGD